MRRREKPRDIEKRQTSDGVDATCHDTNILLPRYIENVRAFTAENIGRSMTLCWSADPIRRITLLPSVYPGRDGLIDPPGEYVPIQRNDSGTHYDEGCQGELLRIFSYFGMPDFANRRSIFHYERSWSTNKYSRVNRSHHTKGVGTETFRETAKFLLSYADARTSVDLLVYRCLHLAPYPLHFRLCLN